MSSHSMEEFFLFTESNELFEGYKSSNFEISIRSDGWN